MNYPFLQPFDMGLNGLSLGDGLLFVLMLLLVLQLLVGDVGEDDIEEKREDAHVQSLVLDRNPPKVDQVGGKEHDPVHCKSWQELLHYLCMVVYLASIFPENDILEQVEPNVLNWRKYQRINGETVHDLPRFLHMRQVFVGNLGEEFAVPNFQTRSEPAKPKCQKLQITLPVELNFLEG